MDEGKEKRDWVKSFREMFNDQTDWLMNARMKLFGFYNSEPRTRYSIIVWTTLVSTKLGVNDETNS